MKMTVKCVFSLLSLTLMVGLNLAANETINSQSIFVTETLYGRVRGVIERSPYGNVIKFLGIPYAQPPTGPRRFDGPYPPEKWTGHKDAFSFGPDCIQRVSIDLNHTISEDCLYLNVYIPADADISSEPLSVMVWIHGGAYKSQAGSLYDGSGLASHGVIVVTLNYRLDVFGFLSTEDDVIPGNFGMMDQIMALEWVKQNIASFGGNPNHVTIFGESAGASSVSLLVLSPLAKGLFNRAIMESGSALSPWAITHPGTKMSPEMMARLVGMNVGCVGSESVKLLQCLRGVDKDVLFNASQRLQSVIKSPSFVFKPRVENTFGFLPDLPIKLLMAGKFNSVDTLRGFNAEENAHAFMYVGDHSMKKEDFIKTISNSLKSFAFTDKDEFIQKVSNVYNISDTSDPYYIRDQAVQASSNLAFDGPITNELRMLVSKDKSNNSNHYLYHFEYRSSFSYLPKWLHAAHGDELVFVFGDIFQYLGVDFNETDRMVSDQVMRMWTSFAKTGDPNSSNDIDSGFVDEWKPFTSSENFMMDIDLTSNLTIFQFSDKTDLSLKLIQKIDTALHVETWIIG